MPQKRNCTDPDHEGSKFLPVSSFHKKGRRNGRQLYDEKCKKCRNKRLREEYSVNKRSGGWDPEKKRAYSRARSRALTRLSKAVPEAYEFLLLEELRKEPPFAK